MKQRGTNPFKGSQVPVEQEEILYDPVTSQVLKHEVSENNVPPSIPQVAEKSVSEPWQDPRLRRSLENIKKHHSNVFVGTRLNNRK